ncbi:MAG: TolC family protein, partial [Desulfatirhabdiaceae bacterium]
AMEEVENALTAFSEALNRRQSLLYAVESANRAVILARDLFTAGLADFSNVLDAQKSLLSFQNELAASDGAVTSNLVRLYKALGGGWETV